MEPGKQGDHGTVEEGVRFEPRASGGLGRGNGGVRESSGEGLALEAAVGRRGEGLTSPLWLWPPRSDDTQGGGGVRGEEGASGWRGRRAQQRGSAGPAKPRQGAGWER